MTIGGNLIKIGLCAWLLTITGGKDILGQTEILTGLNGASTNCIKGSFEGQALGTRVAATFYYEEGVDIVQLEASFFDIVDSLEAIFSDYKADSEINQLTKEMKRKNAYKVSDPLLDLLKKSQTISMLSGGTFDVSIGSLTRLWRRHLSEERVPSRRKIRRARRKVGYQYILLDTVSNLVVFERSPIQFDFGGIAKGYIADIIANHFRDQGITRFLIDLGGDLLAGDPPLDASHWEIQVGWASQNILVRNAAVATSGPDYQFFVHRGRRYSHIIDPKSGWGVSHPFNCTVISPTGWQADALASVAALNTPLETIKILGALDHVDVLLQRAGELYQSPGFRNYVSKD